MIFKNLVLISRNLNFFPPHYRYGGDKSTRRWECGSQMPKIISQMNDFVAQKFPITREFYRTTLYLPPRVWASKTMVTRSTRVFNAYKIQGCVRKSIILYLYNVPGVHVIVRKLCYACQPWGVWRGTRREKLGGPKRLTVQLDCLSRVVWQPYELVNELYCRIK